MTEINTGELVEQLESGELSLDAFLIRVHSVVEAAGSSVPAPAHEPATVQRAAAGVEKIQSL